MVCIVAGGGVDIPYMGLLQGPRDLFLTVCNDKEERAWSENIAYR
jgi:hypothetical protein